MKDIWNIKYDWTLVTDTWLRNERLEPYWSGVTYIPDNYFKYKKCLSGITYQYVNNLDDIYNKNPMVGYNWCIYNMYNEFDIINNFMVNMDTVDVSSTINLDLTQRYYTIDNAYLKTKHKVLLVNQSNTTENGLYNVDQRGYLISSKFLADSGNTFRYKAYTKLGDNKHLEFHLKNVGDYFPTLSQSSTYMTGKTYIIKNFFSYDLNAVNPVPKLIFTDYDIARHMNPLNYSLYSGFNFSNTFLEGEKAVIKYHDSEYVITITGYTNTFIHSGITSDNIIESFEGTFPPIGWVLTGGTLGWTQNIIPPPIGVIGTKSAIYDCLNIPVIESPGYLQTPIFLVTDDLFSFWCNYYDQGLPGSSAELYVDISIDSGNTWIDGTINYLSGITLSPSPTLDPTGQTWTQFFIDMSIYYEQNITIRFKAISDYGGYDIAIDGVEFATQTVFNQDDKWWDLSTDEAVRTFVKVDADIYNNTNINDYVKFEISGNTNLLYNTFISSKHNSTLYYLSLRDPIPDNLLTDFNGFPYTITNLQWSTTSELSNTLNSVYQSKYFDVDSSMNITPKYYQYNHYFDYDGLSFIYSGSTYYTSGFTTDNTYIKYKLYEHLNSVNPIFNDTYSFLYSLSSTLFTTGFTVLVTDTESSEYYNRYPKGTYIKITPDDPNEVNIFRKNTFVNLNGIYNTLVVDVIPDKYFVIETYKSNSGVTITSINPIYSLTGISELLYSVYKNEPNDWYRHRDDDMRKNICNAYSRIIENDINITRYTTALLTQDDKHKFILEMYNPESLLNNGGHQTFSYDPHLIYKPIELIEIGVDKHTKIPIPILNENLSITYDLLTGATSGTTTGSTSYDIFTFSLKSASIFNYSLISNDSTDLSIDWGDGNAENITFNGVYSNSHTYLITQDYPVTFQGDLQHIKNLTANGNIMMGDITKIINLESLDLSNNSLIDMNINGLIYLKNLNLNDNVFLDSDKYFNIINSNGSMYGGLIDTAGGTNGYITSTSLASRNSLLSRMWTLYYNSPPVVNLPTVVTLTPVSAIGGEGTVTSAKLSGSVTSNGGSNVNNVGFIYSTSPSMTSPTTIVASMSYPPSVPQSIVVTASGLLRLTTYYHQAFATNINGTSYGSIVSFTTN
jgi:hypothetical protein